MSEMNTRYCKITAIIRVEFLERVEKKLQDIGIDGVSVSEVEGFGEYANFFRRDWLVRHARVEIFTERSKSDGIVETIIDCAHTGIAGDGIVAVLPVEKLWRVRNRQPVDETDEQSLGSPVQETPRPE